MDELDLLLEELALGTTGSDNYTGNTSCNAPPGEVRNYCLAGPSQTQHAAAPAHIDSAAESSPPDSLTQELDLILHDMLTLGHEDSAPPTTPPLLTKKHITAEGDKPEGGRSTADVLTSTSSTASDTIDDLLGGLSSDLEKIGVRTITKGHCASCNKPIVGKMITALGEVWHPEHFVCEVCKTELGSRGFFERDGRPYCDKDYHQLFAPRCAYCKGSILNNILTAMDQTWHPEHFFCSQCGCLFGGEGFLVKEGKPYCTKDFYQLFAPKCSGCGESVRENYLSAANGTWHPECFVCSDCLQPFSGGNFMELDGRPLCSLHFHSRQGNLCGSCGAPIMGRCISALDRKFHPEHFTCTFCLRQLSQGIFKQQKGKPYCAACHNKLFV
ncbi:leupaxin [Synchiropus splendidus]|uniref:leupaxin n=1 Tax=Synchiropus splendidus TaxID=270530 RepID=UPI00237DF8C5|nr:leupaxin [Synchiropus splendidus]